MLQAGYQLPPCDRPPVGIHAHAAVESPISSLATAEAVQVAASPPRAIERAERKVE